MSFTRKSILLAVVASVLAAVSYRSLVAQEEDEGSPFPPAITSTESNKAVGSAPEFGYLSRDGAFALKRDKGRAIFAHYSGEEVEVHSHDLVYKGVAGKGEGGRYWVYADPDDKPSLELFFAQKPTPHAGETYRIYMRTNRRLELLARDATRAKLSNK